VHRNSAWLFVRGICFFVVVLLPNDIFAPPSTLKVSVRCEVVDPSCVRRQELSLLLLAATTVGRRLTHRVFVIHFYGS